VNAKNLEIDMRSPLNSPKANKIANHIERLRGEIISQWRNEVRSDSELTALIHKLDDHELEDHLPALTDKIIALLRGETTKDLVEDAVQHGRQRRALGYSVVSMLRELQIFRRVLTSIVQEVVGANISAEETERARNLIIDSVDRSMNISVSQYTLMAEGERNSAQGEARELHDQRDRFLATLSHELRNQVSPILLGAQLLKDLKPSDRRIVTTIERIERQARHQAILIDDLLDISRFRYGKLQLKREDLDLRMPVQYAIETLQNDFQAKQLKLEVELPDGPLNASADETRIAQILINLLSNSLKFTAAGGAVYVKLFERAGAAVLTVRDTGIGIEPVLVPQLFTMFFQTNEPPKGAKSGLGVGLAVAKVLVELHGGTIEAHSGGQGKGAEFTIVLPMVAHIAEVSPPARRVLVVDDNPDHLALLADLLRGRGYDVIEANDASEALRIVADHKPDACVIDIGLPGMDGYELARRLREIPATRESRLIAVTGYGTKSDKEAFQEAGFDHFFPKPPDIEELNLALSQHKANGTH
jgi:signal transduction histidine kinase/CheY-like chemotaxis protein